MTSHSNRTSVFSLLGWGIAAALLVCGLAVPSWILWQFAYHSDQNELGSEHRLMLPLTIATMWPLIVTHLYLRRFVGSVRWEIWFGAMQITGWAVTSWSLAWMMDPERLATDNGKMPFHLAYGCVVFCFAIWLFIPIIACTSLAMIGIVGGWLKKRKRKATDSAGETVVRIQRKPITIKTFCIWMALAAAGLSLNFSKGLLTKEIWKKISHPEALWVLASFVVISLISVVIYGLLNLWLKKVRPHALGWICLITFFPTLPLWTPIRFSRQTNFVEGEILTRVCFLFFLTACLTAIWRIVLHWVSPSQSVEATSNTHLKRSKFSTACGGVLFAGMICWIGFLVVCPVAQFFLRSDGASLDAIHHYMVSVLDGEAEDKDWLDSLNRKLGHGLNPQDNAVVDLIELNLPRLANLKNADRGMESIREYFQLLGVKQDQINDWCDQIAALDNTGASIHEVGTYPAPNLIKFLTEERHKIREGHMEEVPEFAPYEDDYLESTSPSPDSLSGIGLLRKWALESKDAQSRFIESVSDKRIIDAFFENSTKLIDCTPWRDEDFPLAAQYLSANEARLDSLRKLSRKDVYSPWIRLKDQPHRENYVYSDSQRPYNPLLLLRNGESILSISVMNHAGNKTFERAISDLESLARLYPRPWQASLILPTNGRVKFTYNTRKIVDLALTLASHPDFPTQLSERLIGVYRMLVRDDGFPSPAVINIRSNLIADRFYRSRQTQVKWKYFDSYATQEPLFRLSIRYPSLVDWRVFTEAMDQQRCHAIEQYEVARQGNTTQEQRYPWKLIPITKTHFHELFLTGPKGKARALASIFQRNPLWNLASWSRYELSKDRLQETALLLELYRLKHGSYPEQLQDLDPDFTTSVPLDPRSNKPLIYKRLERNYKLYSVGRDKVDDGGDASSDLVYERPIVDLVEAIKYELRR